MKTKKYLFISLVILLSVASLNAQIFQDGSTDYIGIGPGYDLVNPPLSPLEVNGNVDIKNGGLLSEGVPVVLNTFDVSSSNVALNMAIVASSELLPTNPAVNAVDGDGGTSWISSTTTSTDEYLLITLSTESVISALNMTSSTGFGTSIIVEYSLNNIDWSTDPAMQVTDVLSMTNAALTFPQVNAKFVRISMNNISASSFEVDEISITGVEATPEAAIWKKQRDATTAYTNNIIYDKGDVTVGGNFTLKGWDDNLVEWVPKTMQLNWRGSLLFSRFLIQEPMIDGTVWNRGLISQNLRWNETSGVYDIMGGGSNYPDFSAMIFENRGDIGFFTHDQSPIADNLTKEELEAYRRMTITKEGDLKIPIAIQIGDEGLSETTLSNLKSNSSLWSSSLPDYIGTSKYVHIGSGLPCDECELTVTGNISTEDIDVTGEVTSQKLSVNGDIYQNGTLLNITGANMWDDTDGNLYTSNNVGIGTAPCSDVELKVDGIIMANSVTLKDPVPSCDYVFEESYKLMSISEVDSFITENKHLPGIPSAKEFSEDGYNVGEMDNLLLKKVEELTLYIIALKKENDELRGAINSIKK